MCQHHTLSVRRRAFVVAVIALMSASFLLSAGCKSRTEATIGQGVAPDATGTVQAPMAIAATGTATTSTPGAQPNSAQSPSLSSSMAPDVAPANPNGNTDVVVPAGKIWPTKVGQFALNFKGPTWYPKTIPSGMKIDSLDVVELEPGAGLVCDLAFVKGDKAITFTQGSPKTRDYTVVSAGKTAWGTETADITHEDPADSSSPVIIVYNKGGNFAELSGDYSLAQMKAIAASMVLVK